MTSNTNTFSIAEPRLVGYACSKKFTTWAREKARVAYELVLDATVDFRGSFLFTSAQPYLVCVLFGKSMSQQRGNPTGRYE